MMETPNITSRISFIGIKNNSLQTSELIFFLRSNWLAVFFSFSILSVENFPWVLFTFENSRRFVLRLNNINKHFITRFKLIKLKHQVEIKIKSSSEENILIHYLSKQPDQPVHLFLFLKENERKYCGRLCLFWIMIICPVVFYCWWRHNVLHLCCRRRQEI